MKQHIAAEFLEAQQVLDAFVGDSTNFNKIESAGKILTDAFSASRKVISCGNGGSMCDAMHFAEELSGRFRDDRPALPAMAISDPSFITCAANDYGYENSFARYVEAFGKPGDVLVAISTSGNSSNVLAAVRAAREAEMKIIGLTGKDGGKMASLCDIEIRAPFSEYADRAQEIHIKVIHSLILIVEKTLFSH
ncbi:MAG TPA: D-sedoheptulose 7-phosphate isomerase [Bacteroidia bacterium]|nr:D-sedoheptulose 7-phosphate isomerase [Bacteroidia bacterium]